VDALGRRRDREHGLHVAQADARHEERVVLGGLEAGSGGNSRPFAPASWTPEDPPMLRSRYASAPSCAGALPTLGSVSFEYRLRNTVTTPGTMTDSPLTISDRSVAHA